MLFRSYSIEGGFEDAWIRPAIGGHAQIVLESVFSGVGSRHTDWIRVQQFFALQCNFANARVCLGSVVGCLSIRSCTSFVSFSRIIESACANGFGEKSIEAMTNSSLMRLPWGSAIAYVQSLKEERVWIVSHSVHVHVRMCDAIGRVVMRACGTICTGGWIPAGLKVICHSMFCCLSARAFLHIYPSCVPLDQAE